MKHMYTLITAFTFLLGGCQFESPLTSEHRIVIDPAVLGLWELEQDSGHTGRNEQVMILKFSDTEYLVHYPIAGNDEAYYRGYAVDLGGISCVQLQIIGNAKGPVGQDEKKPYAVVTYQRDGDRLTIKLLNTDLLGDDVHTPEELKAAFLKNKNNKRLFVNPGLFTKVL